MAEPVAAYGVGILAPRAGQWQFPTHIGHTAAEIARPTAAIRSITATALPRKHSFDASQQPFALNPWAERA
jgi:hypothetical protein